MSQRFEALHSDDDDSLLPVYIGFERGADGVTDAGSAVGDEDQSMHEVVKVGQRLIIPLPTAAGSST